MLSGDFERLLLGLSPKLRIRLGSSNDFWGIHFWLPRYDEEHCSEPYRIGGNWRFVCGVPPNWLPERTIKSGGVIQRRGWREAVSLVHGQGYIERVPEVLGGGNILRYGTPIGF